MTHNSDSQQRGNMTGGGCAQTGVHKPSPTHGGAGQLVFPSPTETDSTSSLMHMQTVATAGHAEDMTRDVAAQQATYGESFQPAWSPYDPSSECVLEHTAGKRL